MKNFIAALFSMFYFINLFNQINCNRNNNDQCYDMNEFKNQKMKVVNKEMYRIKKRNDKLYLAVGNEPFIFWLKVESNDDIDAKLQHIGKAKDPWFVKTYVEVFGRSDCRFEFDVNGEVYFIPQCGRCTKYKGLYVPFKIWTDGGPVELGNIKQGSKELKFYFPQLFFDRYNVLNCENVAFTKNPITEKDYAYLKPDEGIEYLQLNHEYTIVWVEVSDLFPVHYLFIELEDGQISNGHVTFELEANGQKPENISTDPLSNGLRIKIKKAFCQHSYKYVGFVRYIVHIISGKFKISFYDSELKKKIKMKFWPNEPLPTRSSYNFTTFKIPPLPVLSATTLTPSTTSLITTTTTLFIPSTTVSPYPTTSTESSLLTTSNILISPSTTTVSRYSAISSLPSTSTTTVSQNNGYVRNETNEDEIEQTSFVPLIPNPSKIKSKAESAETSEESEGMSLSILIPILVGSLFGLLIIICIIVICILRCYRSYQRKKYQLSHLETRTQAEEAVRQKRSFWKNIIIALIGPDPKPSKGRRNAPTPSSLKSIPESIQNRPTSNPTTPVGNPRSGSNTPAAPTPNESKTQTISKSSTPAPLAPPPKSPSLRLQRTQSIPKSSQSQTYSTTLRAAKKAKRDPRFPHLIPGTIEFIVAKQQCDNGSFDGDGPKSGPRDESDIIQFINPN